MKNINFNIYKRGVAIDKLSKVEEDIIKYLFKESNQKNTNKENIQINVEELTKILNIKYDKLNFINKDILMKIYDIFNLFIEYSKSNERGTLKILTYVKTVVGRDETILVGINIKSQELIMNILNLKIGDE